MPDVPRIKISEPLSPTTNHIFAGSTAPPVQNMTPSRNALLGMMLFLGADLMFFAGLIGAFLVFRVSSLHWPPANLPTLPIAVTTINTFILLTSGVSMLWTWRTLNQNLHLTRVTSGLVTTLGLGLIFLLVQGFEWIRMLNFGLTISTGVFGGIFFVLIGSHAIHVACAVIWLAVVKIRLRTNPTETFAAIKLAGLYWFLVVLLWPAIYLLVYWS